MTEVVGAQAPTPVSYPRGVVPTIGLKVKGVNLIPPKNEEEIGKLKIVLEGDKDDLRAADHDITSILGALNMHQSTAETVALGLRFT